MQYLNVSEASKILNVNEETIRRWIREGKIKAEKHGGRIGYRIDRNILDDFISENKFWKPSNDFNIHNNNLDKVNTAHYSNSYDSSNPFLTNTSTSVAKIIECFCAGIVAAVTPSIVGAAANSTCTCGDSSSNKTLNSKDLSYTINIDLCSKYIDTEIASVLNIDSNILDNNYLDFINSFSKLESVLSSSLNKVREVNLYLSSKYLRSDTKNNHNK